VATLHAFKPTFRARQHGHEVITNNAVRAANDLLIHFGPSNHESRAVTSLFPRRHLGHALFQSSSEFVQLFLNLIHAGNSSLVLLLCVPWHLRLTAQPLLAGPPCAVPRFRDSTRGSVCELLPALVDRLSLPWPTHSREIIGDFWAISQNQSTKLQRSHRRPMPTTDERLTQPLQRLRPAGPHGATRCDLWWARYLPPFTHAFLRSIPRLHG
jgi:hypothetical protein